MQLFSLSFAGAHSVVHLYLAACLLSQKRGFDSVIAVQELIEGKSLAQMVEAGWQPAQKEVERIAHELLTTFSYLQQQQV